MSNALIPYSFTPGTKAKAQEVNANFKTLADKIEEINTTTIKPNSNSTISGQMTFTQPIYSAVKQLNNAGNIVIVGLDDNKTIDLINIQNDKDLLSGSFRITNGAGYNETAITAASEDGKKLEQLGIRNTNGVAYAYAPTYTSNYGDNSNKIVTTKFLASHWAFSTPSKTTSASTARPAVVTTNYFNGTSGYRVWSDGFCEQWGRFSHPQRVDQTINLIKPYTDTNYNIQLTSISDIASDEGTKIKSRTNKSFTIWAWEYRTIEWKACGYIKKQGENNEP